jgi:hypothetical protein
MASSKLTNVVVCSLGAAVCLFAFSFLFANKASIISLWIMGGFALIAFAVMRRPNFQWLYVFPALMMAMRIVSVINNPSINMGKIETQWSLLAIPFAFSLFKLNARQTQRLLIAIFYSLLAAALLLWAAWLKNVAPQHCMEALLCPKGFYPLFLKPPYWNWQPSHAAIILAMALPLAMYLRFNKGIPSLMLWAAMVIVLPMVHFTGARIGVVVCLLLLGGGFVFYARKFIAPERAVILLVMAAAILFVRHLPYNITEDCIRSDLRALGKHAIAEQQWMGSGVYSMEGYIGNAEFAASHNLPAYPFNHFHCAPIDEVVQFGWIGGAVMALFALSLLCVAARRRDYLLYSYLLVYVPFMLIDSPFQSVKGIMPMLFWLCLIVSTQQTRRQSAAIAPK